MKFIVDLVSKSKYLGHIWLIFAQTSLYHGVAFIRNLESFEEKRAQCFNFFDVFSEDYLSSVLLEQGLAIGAQCLDGLWFAIVNTLHSEV